MGFWRSRRRGPRMVVLGLDGTPWSFLARMIDEGEMPNLRALVEEGTFSPMHSVYPTVSSSAWSSFMTGKNPGGHNIYGFVDRIPGTYQYFLPNSAHMLGSTLWEDLSRAGKRVVVINVPVTYPPREVNGVLIAGFLANNIGEACTNSRVVEKMKAIGYEIDIDAWQARQSRDQLLEDLNRVFEKRCQLMWHLFEGERWDFFLTHIMCTDRLHHFLWEEMERKDPTFYPPFMAFYHRIDELLGKVAARLDDRTDLLLLSDHGFCSIKKELFINKWLADNGYLTLNADDEAEFLERIDPQETRAYSLIPGRIFLNLKGREPGGVVQPGKAAASLLRELREGLLELRDPETGETMIEQVFEREDVFSGAAIAAAPDLLAVPAQGYDVKGTIDPPELAKRGNLCGMHTFDDAFFYVRDRVSLPSTFDITYLMPTILKRFGIAPSADLDHPEGLF